MATNVLALRKGVLGATALLVAVLITLLVTARLAGHHFHFDLPNRLGVDISQTANGFTYSQSSRGHTLFTIHASKVIEYKADQARLHDVSITLYGPAGSNRTDTIKGNDFLYDRKQGIATAQGDVEIEMAPPTETATPPGATPQKASDKQPIHIHTTSMSFNENTSEASTDAPVDFTLTNAAGHAVGARYNSKTGVLFLNSQVVLTSQRDNGVATVRASNAEYLRDGPLAYLLDASTDYDGEKSSADRATLHFRPDGSIEQLEGQGRVHVLLSDGAEIHTVRANVALDPMSQPVRAEMFDGVNYTSGVQAPGGESGGESRSMHGSAVEGTLDFVGKGELKHAQFRNAVSFVDQLQSGPGQRASSSTREVRSSALDVDFSVSPGGKSLADAALAVGQPNGAQAVVNVHDVAAAAAGAPSTDKVTTIYGDRLLATLADGHAIRRLDGQGRTKVVESTPDGAGDTSTGDKLVAHFVVVPKGAPRPPSDQAIESAVQTGNVTMVQQPARSVKNAVPLRATAQKAEFGGQDQLLHLSGGPHVNDGSLDVTADLVDYHRDTGDASAHGKVKATYIEAPAAGQEKPSAARAGPTLGGHGPVHITAQQAEMKRADDLSLFYGSPETPARMWQGEDYVTAPVLELSKQDQTLYAHGGPHERGVPVHAALSQNSTKGSSGETSVTRVQAQVLHYLDKAPDADASGDKAWRRADFSGSVVAEETTGVIHADDANIFLTPELPNKPSQLDHILATGHVVITQPGRRGVGEKLVYTAGDARYVLTGTPGAPPRVTDAEKGTTTGAALIFKSANDSVEVAGDGAQKPSRTVTDTHSPK